MITSLLLLLITLLIVGAVLYGIYYVASLWFNGVPLRIILSLLVLIFLLVVVLQTTRLLS